MYNLTIATDHCIFDNVSYKMGSTNVKCVRITGEFIQPCLDVPTCRVRLSAALEQFHPVTSTCATSELTHLGFSENQIQIHQVIR